MKRRISIILLLVLVSALTFQGASAAPSFFQGDATDFLESTTIFVDISNDSGIEDGTADYPFNTIQEGIDFAPSDNAVRVAPGTYHEHVVVTRGIDLIGAGATSTIIDGSGSGTVVSIGDASLLQGFTIQHGSAYFGAGIVTTGSPKITNNIIRNNAQGAGGSGAAIHGNNSSPIITGNIIRENTADTQFLSGAISFINSSSPYITNNVISNNTGRGAINLTLPAGNTPIVMNNTILGNAGAGIKLDVRVNQSDVVVANNILLGNSAGIQLDFGTSANWPIFEYNDVFGNTTDYVGMSDLTGTDGNISLDPMFADEFHLSYQSPLIDVGSLTYYAISDFDGEARPLDGNGDGVLQSDIGADERLFVDENPPILSVTATKEDGTAYTADTWTNQTVTVKFICSDPESGIASCPADQAFSTDGVTPLTTGTATDNAGNSASIDFGPIKIDKTPPTLSISVSPNTVLLNGNAELLKNGADELSGIHSEACMNINTGIVGSKSVFCTVIDNAANMTTATAEYQVVYDFEGFLSPVVDCVNNTCDEYNLSTFKAGTRISLKFRLKDAQGNIVQTANAPLWLVPTRITSTPPVSFPEDYVFQVSGIPYGWNVSQNAYRYDWNTKWLPRYSVWLVGVQLDDGKTYYVFVALK